MTDPAVAGSDFGGKQACTIIAANPTSLLGVRSAKRMSDPVRNSGGDLEVCTTNNRMSPGVNFAVADVRRPLSAREYRASVRTPRLHAKWRVTRVSALVPGETWAVAGTSQLRHPSHGSRLSMSHVKKYPRTKLPGTITTCSPGEPRLTPDIGGIDKRTKKSV